MRFRHNEFTLSDEGDNQKNNNFIFLSSEEDNEYEIIAAAISVDIRGHYGMILNSMNTSKEEYIWKGNLFAVRLEKTNNKFQDEKVSVYSLDEEDICIVDKREFIEALEDWKNYYLEKMGFNEFNSSKALSHIYATLILAYDKLDEDESNDISNELFIYSMHQCAERYGITYSTICNQCRSVTLENNIFEFRMLASKLLINNDYMIIDLLEKKFGVNDDIRDKFLNIIR